MSFLRASNSGGLTSSPSMRPSKQNGPVSAPSPTPSTASNSSKRKRPATPNTMPSTQPAGMGSDSDLGLRAVVQAQLVVDYLKAKPDQSFTFDDLVNYLSIQAAEAGFKLILEQRLQGLSTVAYNPKGFVGKGSYKFKPPYDIKSPDELKGFLQRQRAALPVAVGLLEEGWKDARAALATMKDKHEVLVAWAKEGKPKYVWLDDPTLHHHIDLQFREEWHKVSLPANPDELRKNLEEAGLKPTSAPREAATAGAGKKEKRKPVRRGGRQTNTHMAGILKDYSHKRK